MANSNSTTTAEEEEVPRPVLLSFFLEATQALKSLHQSRDDRPVLYSECQSRLLAEQRICLDRVVSDYNASHNTQLDTATVQQALASVTNQDPELEPSRVAMNDAARLAFAWMVVSSECQRTGTTSLNDIPASPTSALRTSRMSRSAMLEFCALGVAATRLEQVQAHIRNASVPLLEWSGTENSSSDHGGNTSNNSNDPPTLESLKIPPMKRLEHLQRLLLQAMGFDPDTALPELARQVQGNNDDDDVEFCQVIRQATASMMESVLGNNTSNSNNTTAWRQPELLLSDQELGGVTRVVSVQHSETLVQVEPSEEGGAAQVGTAGAATAPVSQSMRDNDEDEGHHQFENGHSSSNPIQQQQQQQQFKMAREAAQLRQSLVDELTTMPEKDRQSLLRDAEEAMQTFQQQALEFPPGPERIDFLRNMDAHTKKLLTMHRIWQEENAKK